MRDLGFMESKVADTLSEHIFGNTCTNAVAPRNGKHDTHMTPGGPTKQLPPISFTLQLPNIDNPGFYTVARFIKKRFAQRYCCQNKLASPCFLWLHQKRALVSLAFTRALVGDTCIVSVLEIVGEKEADGPAAAVGACESSPNLEKHSRL